MGDLKATKRFAVAIAACQDKPTPIRGPLRQNMRLPTPPARMLLAALAFSAASLSAHADLFGKPSLPTPLEFSNTMELGDVRQAAAWLGMGLPPDFLGGRIGTGLMIGAWEGNIDMMELFIERGAYVDQSNSVGETALVLAAWRGNLPAVKWLLAHGAPINGSHAEWSALHYAAFAGHKEVAEFLLANGADINARSPNGSTPLMMTAYEGQPALAKLLVEAGANTNIRNDRGDGALEWSMRYNRLDIARMVTTPDGFKAAMALSKEQWGSGNRALPGSKELERLIAEREALPSGVGTNRLDQAIRLEGARLVRYDLERNGQPTRLAAVEVTARRQVPMEQAMEIVMVPPKNPGPGEAQQERAAKPSIRVY